MNSTTPLPNASNPTKVIFDTSGKSPTQPHTDPITNLASTPNPIATGSLLGLNDNYIVYAVKNGLIRVMDRSSSLRTLLRGHKERITDVSFFGSSSDILASVCPSDCRVWRVFGREDELSSEMLLEIQKDENNEGTLERVVWHPFNPNQFILLHKGNSVATFVETTRLLTTASTEEGQAHAVCEMKDDQNVDGMLKFVVTDAFSSDCGINDLTWSNLDARHVLTSHNDGAVRLWDLRNTVYTLNGKEVDATTSDLSACTMSAKCVKTVRVSSGDSVQKAFFLSAFEDACSMFRAGGTTGMEECSYMTSPFISYTSDGEVTLWSPFTMTGSPPSVVRTFKLGNESPTPSNISVCDIPSLSDEGEAPSTFVILSDEKGNVYALHLASQLREIPASGSTPSRKVGAVIGFDYIVVFKSLQPIYSQSVLSSLDEDSDVKQFNVDLFCVQSKAVQKLTLSPSMLAPPVALEAGIVADGVSVGEVEMMIPITSENVAASNVEFQDYEDLDESYESNEEEEDEGDADEPTLTNETVSVPPAASSMPSFLGGQGDGAFSNWLGNLAGVTKKEEQESMPSAKTDIDLSSLPLPEAPKIDVRATSAPPKQENSELLSPMQILGMNVKKADEIVAPVRAGSNKRPPKQSEKKSKPLNEDKKIKILKREEPSTAANPNPTPSSATEAKVSSASTVGVTKEEIEEIVKKSIASHFQKHESFVTGQIQKAVRYEVQSGLVPSLNKTVSQTLEQTISKTMKTNVSKTVQDTLTTNSEQLASSLTNSLQEPIVNSFHSTMKDVIVPAYENGTRQMFEQISAAVEAGLATKAKEQDETMKMMDGMVKRMDAMGKTIEVLIKAVAQLQTGPTPPVNSPTKSPEQVAAEKMDQLKRAIVKLFRAGDFEKGFTQALSVSNSAMALFACQQSDLSMVLEGDVPKLSQPIMLCLMQQLGADLSTNEELAVKLAWLQSMALVLNPQDPSIAKHIQGVVQQLVVNLQTKMAESDPALRRHLQMLLQVIRGIGNS